MPDRLNHNDVTEGLTTMVLTFRDDPQLSAWFENLERVSRPERQLEILRMRRVLIGSGMRDADKIAKWLMLLVDDRVFGAAVVAYREL